MKNYIDVYDENGNHKQMEVVSTFNLEGFSDNYIIYSETDKSHFYIAKYKGDQIIDLDTNLSNEELILCNKVFKEILKNVRNQ